MSTATAQFLKELDQPSPDEQREFSTAILQRTTQFDYGEITDEELTASAGRLFAMLDEEEEDAQTR